MARDPLDVIADICRDQPHDALTQIAAVLGFNEPSADPTWQHAVDDQLVGFGRTSQEFATPHEAVQWLLQQTAEAARAVGVPTPPAPQPVAWLDSFGEPHRRREDAWDGDPESAEPRPLYLHAAGVPGTFNDQPEGHEMKTILTIATVALLAGCSDADIASSNLSKAADNFEVMRRVVFYNGITGEYMLTIEGLCSLGNDDGGANKARQRTITCKTGPGEYKKHFLGLSDNVTYFAEQVAPVKASAFYYRVTFKPQAIVPDIDARGSTELPGQKR